VVGVEALLCGRHMGDGQQRAPGTSRRTDLKFVGLADDAPEMQTILERRPVVAHLGERNRQFGEWRGAL